jgi:type IV pilus assembly protein PilN
MRLNINLATRKYEDVQQFFFRWGVALAVLAGLAILLAALSVFKYSSAIKNAKETKDLQQKIAVLQKELSDMRAIDNSPENREVTQEKKYWNSQIARRSLSWTQLLNDLQKIMPARAYLDSVQPELTSDNRLKLKLVIVGEKHDDALELVKKMESSARFRSVRITSDNVRQKNTQNQVRGPGVIYKIDIETEYAPATAAPPGAATREGT